MRVVVALMTLCLLVTATPARAVKCGEGPGDLAAVASVRAAANSDCDANGLGCTTAPAHGAYVSCIADFAKRAVAAGNLPAQCKGAVVECAAKSTCGRPDAVTCCRTNAKGSTRCSIKKSAVRCRAPHGGAACVGAFSSCCDACEATGCTPGTTTTTTTLPPCATDQYPTCGGSCGDGFQCLPALLESPIGPTFPDCRCAPVGVQCVGPHPAESTCEGGLCPPGLACHMFTLFTCSAYSCIDQSSFP